MANVRSQFSRVLHLVKQKSEEATVAPPHSGKTALLESGARQPSASYQSRLLMCGFLTALVSLSSACEATQSSVQVPTLPAAQEQPTDPALEQNGGSFDHSEEDTLALESYTILPRTVDPTVDDWLAPHYVMAPAAPSTNKLLVFLPGSFGEPQRQQLFTQTAAQLGHHAINLSYPNSWTVARLCARSRDPDCTSKVRREIIQGEDFSPEVQISRANSIEMRLQQALKYLNSQHPQQGWNQYLTQDGDLAWDTIIIAGHSQGGGHAAMIGKLHSVDRVIMLAAPADISRRMRSLAPWLSEPGATPPERYFGLVHTRDRGYERIQTAWETLGLGKFGSVVLIDRSAPPYQNSHQLVTSVQPSRSDKFHGSVVTDGTTPQSNNQPILRPVWQYLLEAKD